MKKSIPTADVRERFKRDIDFWLKEEAEKEAEKQARTLGSYERRDASTEAYKYHSMAFALYLAGSSLGVVSAEDYPQLDPSEEAQS